MVALEEKKHSDLKEFLSVFCILVCLVVVLYGCWTIWFDSFFADLPGTDGEYLPRDWRYR